VSVLTSGTAMTVVSVMKAYRIPKKTTAAQSQLSDNQCITATVVKVSVSPVRVDAAH
jgi:hypothetical protein